MRLRAFYAKDGDCLLLTSGDGHHVLVDGGRSASFGAITRPVLQDLAEHAEAVDLVVVSHIDADHISGILSLLEDYAAWAVHDYQVGDGGNAGFPAPTAPRPPTIHGLWHNSWRAQVGDDLAGPIESVATDVAASVALAGVDLDELSRPAARAIDAMQLLAESIPDGIRLLRLVDEDTPIPRNEGFGPLVLLRSPVQTVRIGSTTLTVLGPSREHLEDLRAEWRRWLERQSADGQRAVGRSRGGGRGRQTGLGPATTGPAPTLGLGDSELALAVESAMASAADIVDSIATAAEVIEQTNPAAVTPPNRASIIVLAEEAGRSCLLTGDANEEEILEGLRAAGRLADGPFWCDVLKVQHHGSEHNLSVDFAKQVLAGTYVFSADGAHGNPNPSIVKTVVTGRLTDPRPFALAFTCAESRTTAERRTALRAALREARKAQTKHPDRVSVVVLEDDEPFLDIEV